jgi:hypothetical protein
VDVENEARRSQAQVVSMSGDPNHKGSPPSAALEAADQYKKGEADVRKQFRDSPLGKELDKRKDEIQSKGDKAVAKASDQAIQSLEKYTREARRSARQMARNARKTLESQRSAFRARVAGEGRSLVAMSRGESKGALNGLSGAAKAGLPAFANTITAIEQGLRAAAGNGARGLDAATTGAVEDAPGRMAAIARVQREKLQTTHAGTRLSIETGEALCRAGVDTDRDRSMAAQEASSRDASRQITESTLRQTSGFGAVAKGVTNAAKEWETPLAEVFKKAIQQTKDHQENDQGEGSFNAWAKKTNEGKDKFIGNSLTPYLAPETFFKKILDDAVSRADERVTNAINEVPQALNSGIIDVVDETRLDNAIRGLTAIQGREVAFEYQKGVGISLDLKLQRLAYSGDLKYDEYQAALNYLAGNTALGAAWELRASIHWYGDEKSRIEHLMRDLTPEQMKELNSSEDGRDALAYVRDNLTGTNLQVVNALAAYNPARADAYRYLEALDKARRKGDIEKINELTADYSKASADRAWGDPVGATERRVRVQQEFAYILQGGTAEGAASTIKPEEALETVQTYALKPMDVVVYRGGREGGYETIRVTIDGPARDLAEANLTSGATSVGAKTARLAVEIQRPGGPDILKLDTALYDPRLDPNTNPSEKDREQGKKDRDAIFARFASKYGTGNPLAAQMSAQAFAEHQLRASFGDDKLAANLAAGMVNDEHPTPETAALALEYAARGWGTKEDIIWRFTERLNRDQIQDLRKDFRKNTGKGLDETFGAFGKGGIFTELSGDDRLRFERALLGKPRNAQEEAEVAAYTAQQQRDNTGWLGSLLGSGSDQEKMLSYQEKNFARVVGGTIRVDDDGNPVWYGPDGQLIKGPSDQFDQKGRFKGDPNEFNAAVSRLEAAAQNYAARIDTYANFVTGAIAIIGAIALTIVTAGGASPLVAAAIAGAAGLAGMAAHRMISGGRYGWEQAVTDLAMTAVQALTAGVGQHLALLSRGANMSFAAGMTTFRSVEGLAEGMGAITGSAVGDMILMGGAIGGIGALGQAALSEKTWENGLAAGFEELLASAIKGMVAGGATAAASQAFEHIPLDRLGKPGNIGEILGKSESVLARSAFRGTTSGVGAMTGRAVEMGMDSDSQGEGDGFIEGMFEAGGQAAFQDFLGGAAQAHLDDHKVARQRAAAAREPAEHPGPRRAAPEETTPERAAGQPEEQVAHPEHGARAVTPEGHAAAGREAAPLVPPVTPAPVEQFPTEPVAAPPPEAPAAPVHEPEAPAVAEPPAVAETPSAAAAAERPGRAPTAEESFADFAELIRSIEESPLDDRLAAAAAGPATPAPADPARTPKQAKDAAYRGSRAASPGAPMAAGEQIQHWTKVLDATTKLPPGMQPLPPDVINENRSWLQSRRDQAARTLLTDPAGGGTRYFVGERTYGGAGEPFGPHEQLSLAGTEPPWPERVYGTEHKFADQYLIPEIRDQIQTRRAEFGLPPLDPRDLAIAAGEQARWIMEGTPGTTWSGASIDLGRAGPQQLLLAPEILSPELHARGLTVEPSAPRSRWAAETPQTSFDFERPAADTGQTSLDFDRTAPQAEPGGGGRGPGEAPPGGAPGGGEDGGGFDFTDAEFEKAFGELKPEKPGVRVPVHPDEPARVLEVGAGMRPTDLGMPPTEGVIEVTSTDLNPSRPGVEQLDATKPLDPQYRERFDTVLINNPRRYAPNIAELGNALRGNGRIIIQGKGEEFPGQRRINPDFQKILEMPAPPGYRKIVDLPPGPPGTSRPEHILGGPFFRTTGEPVNWPNGRVIFEKVSGEHFVGDRPYGGPGQPFGPHEQLSLPGMEPPHPDRIYDTVRDLAEGYLVPEIGRQIQARRSELGLPPLEPAARSDAAEAEARWRLQGSAGPTQAGATVGLGRAGPQQLLLKPETLSPELNARGLTVEPAPPPARVAVETPQTSLNFERPPAETPQASFDFERPLAAAQSRVLSGALGEPMTLFDEHNRPVRLRSGQIESPPDRPVPLILDPNSPPVKVQTGKVIPSAQATPELYLPRAGADLSDLRNASAAAAAETLLGGETRLVGPDGRPISGQVPPAVPAILDASGRPIRTPQIGPTIVDLQAGTPRFLRQAVEQAGGRGVGVEPGNWLLAYQGIYPTRPADYEMALMLTRNSPVWPDTPAFRTSLEAMPRALPWEMDPATHLFPREGPVIMLPDPQNPHLGRGFFSPMGGKLPPIKPRQVPFSPRDITGFRNTPPFPELSGQADRIYLRRAFGLAHATPEETSMMGRQIAEMLRPGADSFLEIRALDQFGSTAEARARAGDPSAIDQVALIAAQIPGARVERVTGAQIRAYRTIEKLENVENPDSSQTKSLAEARKNLGNPTPRQIEMIRDAMTDVEGLGKGEYKTVVRIYRGS